MLGIIEKIRNLRFPMNGYISERASNIEREGFFQQEGVFRVKQNCNKRNMLIPEVACEATSLFFYSDIISSR